MSNVIDFGTREAYQPPDPSYDEAPPNIPKLLRRELKRIMKTFPRLTAFHLIITTEDDPGWWNTHLGFEGNLDQLLVALKDSTECVEAEIVNNAYGEQNDLADFE